MQPPAASPGRNAPPRDPRQPFRGKASNYAGAIFCSFRGVRSSAF